MARLWQSGFELNSIASGVEWTTPMSTPSIQTSVVRSGTYAMNITSLSSTVQKGLAHRFKSGNDNGPFFFRQYFRFDTISSGTNRIIKIQDTGSTSRVWINLTNTGTLTLNDEDGAIGSASSALTLNQWYRIEIKVDLTAAAGSHVVEARIDGVQFAASSTRNISTGVAIITMGGNMAGEAQTQGNWYIDDVAINDSTGSFQNSWPGEGKIIHLKPNEAGDSNGYLTQVGGDAGASNNFTRVDEVTPDDATSYNGSALLNAEDLFNCEASGIGGSDTVSVVAVGCRMADLVAADATASFKLEIEKTAGGTKVQSATIIPNSTTWLTNAAALPRNYSLVTYQDPDNNNWTQSTLDSMQIGYIQDAVNVQTIAISTLWASVDYIPGTGVTIRHALSLMGVGS